jgi:hypothetical protein
MSVAGERLLRTSRAECWLRQFDPRDRGAAELLVRSLILVSKDELDTTLAELIRHRRIEVRNDPLRPGEPEKPIALYGIREIENYCELPSGSIRPRYNSAILTRGQVDSKHRAQEIGTSLLPVYFENCRRDARASPVRAREVGSEGDIAYLIERLRRETLRQPGGFLAHPSLDKLRKNECRDVFLIDDLIGSGDRASRFILAFCRHPTIASWLSGGFLRVSVIAFAATRWGLTQVRNTKPRVSAVHHQHDVLSGQHWWPEDQRETLLDLCRRYGEKTGQPEMALGYGSTDAYPEGLCCMVFSYKCPNNAPAILWAGKGKAWMPLFERSPSDGLLACFQAGSEDAQRSVLVALLGALHGRQRLSVEEVNRRTGLGMSVSQRWLEWCEVNGLVDGLAEDRMRLTRAGRRELQHPGQIEEARPRKGGIAEPEPFYYPSKLRASRG